MENAGRSGVSLESLAAQWMQDPFRELNAIFNESCIVRKRDIVWKRGRKALRHKEFKE